eukprot:7386035-Prymnesium_polylepis.1
MHDVDRGAGLHDRLFELAQCLFVILHRDPPDKRSSFGGNWSVFGRRFTNALQTLVVALESPLDVEIPLGARPWQHGRRAGDGYDGGALRGLKATGLGWKRLD